MRLWTVHPKYLDSKGLTAAWREGLLALKVLRGRTTGYRNHPQLIRFRQCSRPVTAMKTYLRAIVEEADRRGYRFDASKLGRVAPCRGRLTETRGQLRCEWKHLLGKLQARDPARFRRLKKIRTPDAHPLFRIVAGRGRDWEHTEP
jgi:hypothetical protein